MQNLKTINPCGPCFCTGTAVTIQNRQGVWGAVCLDCGAGVYGYKSETEAERSWREEVVRRGREARA